jgi:hypothetical protein
MKRILEMKLSPFQSLNFRTGAFFQGLTPFGFLRAAGLVLVFIYYGFGCKDFRFPSQIAPCQD